MADPSIILHHYDASPFSEKCRLLLGLKQASWQSVIMPSMMPKPDLIPLTGGYRRAPVMQIGADVYCDSQIIMAEIDRRIPSPAGGVGPAWPVNLWADRLFFQLTVAIIFGRLGDKVDPAFIADREKLSGRPFDIAAMSAAAGPAAGEWRAQASWIEASLASSGTAFLAGNAPGIIDIAAFMNIWFLGGSFPKVAAKLLSDFPNVERWREAVAAIGHGTRTELSGAEALEIARRSEPEACPIAHDATEAQGLEAGQAVIVMADDYGRDPIPGTLVAAGIDRIVIRRDTEDLGAIHLHFPRGGFVVVAAS